MSTLGIIGTHSWGFQERHLKQAALAFDSLVVMGKEWLPAVAAGLARTGGRALLHTADWLGRETATLEYLHRVGIVQPIDFLDEQGLKLWMADLPEAIEQLGQSSTHGDRERWAARIVALAQRMQYREARRLAAKYSKEGWTASVVGAGPSSVRRAIQPGTHAVLSVVCKAIPVPDDNTPWDDIIQFRAEPEARSKYLRLRHWMREAAAQTRSISDLEDEVATLLSEYQTYLAIKKLKFTHSTVATIFAAGAISSAASLPTVALTGVGTLVAIRKLKVELLEAELNAPGRELAYILEAQRQFAPAV